MNPLAKLRYITFNKYEPLIEFLNERISRSTELLNNKNTTTDAGEEIQDFIKGRLDGYIEVKFFVERKIIGPPTENKQSCT